MTSLRYDSHAIHPRDPVSHVVFLDFDGVLNNARTHDRGHRALMWRGVSITGLDPENVAHLRRILEAVPHARIVLSTSWRHAFEFDELKAILADVGIPPERVVGRTTQLNDFRGYEIREWLTDHDRHHGSTPVAVVLDDLPRNDFAAVDGLLVQTQGSVGLTASDAESAIRLLGRSLQ